MTRWTREGIRRKVCRIVSEVLPEAEATTINESNNFVEVLKADSLDLVEIVVDLEREFGIKIPDGDYKAVTINVGGMVDYLCGRLDVGEAPAPSPTPSPLPPMKAAVKKLSAKKAPTSKAAAPKRAAAKKKKQ